VHVQSILALEELRVRAKSNLILRLQEVESVVRPQREQIVSFLTGRRHDKDIDIVLNFLNKFPHLSYFLSFHFHPSNDDQSTDIRRLMAASAQYHGDFGAHIEGWF
jgi:hypothetical protein